MNPPRNESGASAPDTGALLASPFLHRKGILAQGAGVWAEAVCLDTRRDALLLSPIPGRSAGDLLTGSPAAFRLSDGGGLLVATGLLEEAGAEGHARGTLALVVPPGGVERVNRREFYRVTLSLKGKVLFCPQLTSADGGNGSAQPNLEALGRALAAAPRPCGLKDLSLGGARIAVGPPAPPLGERAILQLFVGTAETLGPLPAVVVQSRPDAHAPPTDVSVRLRFDRLPAALEGRLNRYLTQVQRDLLKAGIRG